MISLSAISVNDIRGVVSKRVRQLGLGHRPLVEASPKSSLTDIALKEIIAGKLTYEELKDAAAEA